ncbi:YidC/Oxa1 family membrane protein insertase [Candidatus Gottesmanbacteria bacterium]|nr:YidC/Oxa1 family membrane protein insertase [Candidatus Gottesmanbacteria bacterium]
MNSPTLWNQIVVWPIINLLVAFYKLFEFLHIPGPLGFAIILLTIAIRLLLYPLMQQQLKSAKKMALLKPHLDAISAKHKGDRAKLSQAQMELYKQHGVNPAAGCLPLLLQFPVLIGLYSVFSHVLGNGNLETLVSELNQILYLPFLRLGSLDLTFFGINLGVKPSDFQTYGIWLLSVPLITGLLQWYQTKLMMPTTPPQPPSSVPQSGTTEGKQDTAGEVQKQMAMITPIMFGYFAFQFPLGLALYWNVFGLFGIMQQLRVNAAK